MLKRRAIEFGRVVGAALGLAVLLGAGGCADINIDASGFKLSSLLSRTTAEGRPAPEQMPGPGQTAAPVALADR